LIQESKNTKTNTLFVLINTKEIDIFKKNNILIHNITYHNDIYYINTAKDFITQYSSHNGEVYFLGTGQLWDYYFNDKEATKNMHWEPEFNCLKYLSMFPEEIICTEEYFGKKTEREI